MSQSSRQALLLLLRTTAWHQPPLNSVQPVMLAESRRVRTTLKHSKRAAEVYPLTQPGFNGARGQCDSAMAVRCTALLLLPLEPLGPLGPRVLLSQPRSYLP